MTADLMIESRPAWFDVADCRFAPPVAMFPSASDLQEEAVQAHCVGCPARSDCITYAIGHRLDFGVWGATEEDRRRARLSLKRHPGVTVVDLLLWQRGEADLEEKAS
jgi:WhiB family redox-sensing transcriptional regulator